MDPAELRLQADWLRQKAAQILEVGRRADSGSLKDAFTAMLIEFDNMAIKLDQMADRADGIQQRPKDKAS